jgi:hypothetical protein
MRMSDRGRPLVAVARGTCSGPPRSAGSSLRLRQGYGAAHTGNLYRVRVLALRFAYRPCRRDLGICPLRDSQLFSHCAALTHVVLGVPGPL